MNITLQNKTLLSILSSVKGVVPSRPTFPTQSMVMISPSDDGCFFFTQGPEAQIRCFSEEISIEKPEKKLISVSKIFQISRNFPEDSSISLLFDGDSVAVSCEGGKYQLKSLSAEEFPLMDSTNEKNVIKIAERDFRYLLEKTDFCMASQDPRHYLNGLFFSVDDGKLCAVATDSHRLALSSLAVSSTASAEGILPREIVSEMKRLLSDTKDVAEISITGQKIVVSLQKIQISAKGLNGQFPDYKKVIPSEFLLEIVLDRLQLLTTLQRASAISASSLLDEGAHVSLVFSNNELLVKSSNMDGEEASIKQSVDYTGDNFEISFNSRYLQDVMKVLDTEKIRLQMRDASSGTRIIGEGSDADEYIVMPLRL